MQVGFLLGTLLVVLTTIVTTSARKPESDVDKYLLEYISFLDTFREMKLSKSKEEADSETSFEDVNRAEEVSTPLVVKKKTNRISEKAKRRQDKTKKRPQFHGEIYVKVNFGVNGVDGVDTKTGLHGLEYSGGRGGKGADGAQTYWGDDGGDGGNGNGPTPLKKPKSNLKLTSNPVWTKQSDFWSNSAKHEQSAASKRYTSWWQRPNESGQKEVATDAVSTKRSAASNKSTAQVEGNRNGVKCNIESVIRNSTQQSSQNVTAERGDVRSGDARFITTKDLTTQNNDETANRVRKMGEYIRLNDGQGSDINYVSKATSSKGVATIKEDINQSTDLKGVEVIEQSKRDGLSSYRTADRNDVANKTLIGERNRINKRTKPPASWEWVWSSEE